MSYVPLIERALTEVIGNNASLAALLRGIDALDHSVPTLTELNEAFREIGKSGRFPNFDWNPIDELSYKKAIAENSESMTQMMESMGFSREQQQNVLELHRKLWSKS